MFKVDHWILLVSIVLFAALLQTSTGYGFSIIGTPFLFLLSPAQSAVQINIILSLCISVFMIYKIRHEVDTPLLGRLILGSLLGQLLFKKISQRVFQIFTYVILLFTGLYLVITSL